MRPILQRPGLIGRSAELALLQEELESAIRGSGRCVVIHSDPGVGKTRLLGEFLLAAKRRALVLSARAYPLGTTTPFALIADALEDHVRTLPASELEAIARRSPALGAILPSLGAAPEASRTHVLEDLGRLVDDLARARPVVLALDDVHLADPSTWEAFHHLARHAAERHLLLVVALRSEALAASPSLADLVGSLVQDWVARELVLAPLDRTAISELARRALARDDVPASLAEWLFQKTLGNPLYAMGYLQALSELGDPFDPAGLGAVPDTLRRRVGARVANLAPGSRAALEAVAVIGQRAPAGLVADVVGLSAGALAPLLDDLVARRLLDDDATPQAVVYDFVHPLVQEAVYESVGALGRRELHLRVARVHAGAGRPGAAAAHFARGAEPGDPEALALILQAAQEAESKQSHHEAVAHLGAALALTTDRGRRRELLDELAWQAGLAGDYGSGIPALRELDRQLGEAGDLPGRARAKLRLTSLLSSGLGDQVQAREALDEAERLAAGIDDAQLATRVLIERSWLLGITGSLTDQIRLAGQALASARVLGERESELHSLGSLGHALAVSGRFEEGATALSEGLAIARSANDYAQIGWHGSQVAWSWALAGRIPEAFELYQSLEREIPETHQAHLLEFQGHVKWLAGRWPEAAGDCERMTGTWSPAGMTSREIWSHGTAVIALAEMGRTAEAAAIEARVERRSLPDFYWMNAWYGFAIGVLDAAEGRGDEAIAAFETVAAQLAGMGAIALAPLVYVELAAVAAERHDLDRVEAAAAALERAADQLAPGWYTGLAWLARSWLAGGRGLPAEAHAAAEAAVDALADQAFAFYAARALEARGRACAALGDSGLAAQDLTVALTAYRKLPAPARAEGVLRQLEQLGSEGRRAAARARGASALSPRERAVAVLAARGLTAKEIAQRLFIGERTVESHLASAYSKLGLASKRELMSRARELQLD